MLQTRARHFALTAALLALASASADAQLAEWTVLAPSNGAAGDEFGSSVGVSGGTAVVGAPFADRAGTDSGAAWVFERTNLAFGAGLELAPADGAQDDNFGFAAAISGDTLVVGAPGADEAASGAGAAYVFVRSGSGWAQQAKLLPAGAAGGEAFGGAVGISGDTILVGAPRADRGGSDSGSAYVFVRSGTSWALETELIATDGAAGDLYGVAVAVSGDLAVVGAPRDDDKGADSGSAYVYTRSGTSWSLAIKTLAPGGKADDNFGSAVDCYEPEMSVTVGAPKDDGQATNAGAVHLFARVAGTWSVLNKLFGGGAAEDRFGDGVALGANLTVLAGARLDDALAVDAGLAYRFRGGSSTWRDFGASDASAGDQLGAAVDFDGCWGFSGAPRADAQGANSGAVYVHVLNEPPVSYCTAGVSSNGCEAKVSVAGVASASIPSGFSIQATEVEGGHIGIFYYGLNGRQAIPWAGNSFQCVVPPVRRTGGRLTASGTAGQCDGTFTVDMNGFWNSKPMQNPGPGTVVDAQFWYRDPNKLNPSSAALSNAIEFEVCP